MNTTTQAVRKNDERTASETLTSTAFNILIGDIESHGNRPGDLQRAALLELLDTLSGYAYGTESGRQAFGLATGAGKTSAVAALIVALHRLGIEGVSVAVAASKVEALCGLKLKLMAAGVPEALIGLKHSHGATASLPSTGNEDRRFQLVTHARVRGGNDGDLFIKHEGSRRAVMIYDETLFRSDTFAVSEFSFEHDLAGFGVVAKRAPGGKYAGVYSYLTKCGELIAQGLVSARAEQAGGGTEGVTVNLPPLEQLVFDGYTELLGSVGGSGAKYAALKDLLHISQNPLRLVLTQQHDGVLWFKVSVPDDLADVVILDASHPIRELVNLDSSIKTAGSFHEMDVKRFDNVTIHQMLSPGGRHSITKSFNQVRKENRTVSKEIIEVIKANTQARGILLFTFKKHDVDIAKLLLADLVEAGIDLDELTPDGRKRITLLTWGDETSINGLDHCDVVIMAGVLHRSHLDLASAVLGQRADLTAPLSNRMTSQLLTSEISHLIYQGASRGSCRIVHEGQAAAMKLYLIHRELAIRPILGKVMKGAQWKLWETVHETSSSAGVIDLLCLRIVEYLDTLPPQTTTISTMKLKQEMKLEGESMVRQSFTKAISQVDSLSGTWTLNGRSMVKAGSMFRDKTKTTRPNKT